MIDVTWSSCPALGELFVVVVIVVVVVGLLCIIKLKQLTYICVLADNGEQG